jgi:hypothetical protein
MGKNGDWGSLQQWPEPATTTDDHYTPEWVMKFFDGWFDPCPPGGVNDPEVFDDLKGTWSQEKVFVNPPYSNVLPWAQKAIRSHEKHRNLIVLLLNHDSSTKWYRVLIESGARILMFAERLDFSGPNKIKNGTNPRPSILVVLS